MKTGRPRATRKEIARELERVYERLVRKVTRRFCLRDETDARESVHELALRLLSKGTARVGNWGRFLLKAALNQHRHAQKNKNGRPVLFSRLSKDEQERITEEVPGPAQSPATLAAEDDWKAFVQAEVTKLAARQRSVVTLWSQNFTLELQTRAAPKAQKGRPDAVPGVFSPNGGPREDFTAGEVLERVAAPRQSRKGNGSEAGFGAATRSRFATPGFTHNEIADTLGLKGAATSRSTLRDGLAALEKLLRAKGISDCTFCRRKHSR